MPPSPSAAEIAAAAAHLRAGRLVAFPTETVYGLGANALDPDAIARVYAVKRRPPTSPLIVHVASVEMAKSLVAAWPAAADRLTKKFWPGPLTLVLPVKFSSAQPAGKNSPAIPEIVTAGLPTVALRMPAHPVALALLKAADIPIAAPSANRFTELSPTTAAHVRQSLSIGPDKDVACILDGGPSEVGIESTVVSLAGPHPILLRPGAISRAQLESIIGPVATAADPQSGPHSSPGMHARHYSPRTTLFLVSNGKLPEQGKGIYLQHTNPPARRDIKATQTTQATQTIKTIPMPTTAAAYAAALYETLHQADESNVDWIAIDTPPATPDWEAIQDRLTRAAKSAI